MISRPVRLQDSLIINMLWNETINFFGFLDKINRKDGIWDCGCWLGVARRATRLGWKCHIKIVIESAQFELMLVICFNNMKCLYWLPLIYVIFLLFVKIVKEVFLLSRDLTNQEVKINENNSYTLVYFVI